MLTTPLSLSFYVENGPVTSTSSEEPIQFWMPVMEPDNMELECAFWDDVRNSWSSLGMKLASLVNGTAGCNIRFDQLPLLSADFEPSEALDLAPLPPRKPSLFAVIGRAILASFQCSLASAIFSLEGLANLVDEKKMFWVVRGPGIVTWALLTAAAALLGAARRVDRKEEKHLATLTSKKTACMVVGKQESATLVARVKRQLGILRPDRLRHRSGKAIYAAIFGAKLGVDFAFLQSLYQVSGQTALHLQVLAYVARFHSSPLCEQARILYGCFCKWVRLLGPDLHVTSLERSAVAMCQLFSSLAVAAVFYNQGAVAEGQEAIEGCAIFQDPLAQYVRTAVVSMVALVVGDIPPAILMVLYQKLRSREFVVSHVVFWTFMSSYFVACLLVVCIFQASVSAADGINWMLSTLQRLFFSLLLTPMLLASAAWTCLRLVHLDLDELFPFQPHAEEHLQVKINSVTMSGAGLRQLDINKSSTLRIKLEVAGHPESAIIVEKLAHDGGPSSLEVRFDGVVVHHTVLATVYTSTHRVLGHAVIPVEKCLDGFEDGLALTHKGETIKNVFLHVCVPAPKKSLVSIRTSRFQAIRASLVPAEQAEAEEMNEIEQELAVVGLLFEPPDIQGSENPDVLQELCDEIGVTLVDSDDDGQSSSIDGSVLEVQLDSDGNNENSFKADDNIGNVKSPQGRMTSFQALLPVHA